MKINIVKPKIKTKEEQDYLDYVDEHRNNVCKAFETIGSRVMKYLGMSDSEYDTLRKQIMVHDISKYGEEEFEAYRKRFFPASNEIYDEDEFEKAWIHHYLANPHHWNFWKGIDGEEAKEIPNNYLVELICDWHAMSMKFGGTPLQYYEDNYTKIKLNPKTRQILYGVLVQLYPDKNKL